MAQITIIYGSTGGNTDLVCQTINEIMLSYGHDTIIKRCEIATLSDLQHCDLLIFASPTYGHGQLEINMSKALRSQFTNLNLPNLWCAVIGLGDDKYDDDYNVESATILEKYLLDHGGRLMCPSLKLNRDIVPQLSGPVQRWAKNLQKICQKTFTS